MASKLNDTMIAILQNATTNETPRFVGKIEGKGLTKTIAKLIDRGFLVKTRPDHAGLVAKIGERDYSFQITDLGFAAIDAKPEERHGSNPADSFLKAGVMPKSYHDLYMAQGGGCADPIDYAMKDAFLTLSREVQTKTGKRTEAALDVEAMEKWGREIGLWNDRWNALNPGMRRMNLTNRVRAAVRKGTKITLKMKQGENKGKTIKLEVLPKAA